MRKLAKVDKSKIRKKKDNEKGGMYTLIKDGEDAILNFGKFKGMTITDIAITDEWYLKWIIEQTDIDLKVKKLCGNLIGYSGMEIF